jgi:hypothetical protein
MFAVERFCPEADSIRGNGRCSDWLARSFYLVFLVERSDSHADAILLLDEPGVSLHPLAQQDLSAFFDGLAADNQLLYTSHSPFLIDADRLDRARKVYVGDDGASRVTADLSRTEGNREKRGAAYQRFRNRGAATSDTRAFCWIWVWMRRPRRFA